MPNPDLQSYIATHYLSGPKADAILARSSGEGKPKRKKKKPRTEADVASASTGLVFKDDSDAWKTTADARSDDEDHDAQVVKDGAAGSSGFKKVGSASRTSAPRTEPTSNADAAEAAAPEKEFKAGLRTKEEMRAARLARESRKRQDAPVPTAEERAEEGEQETVYRDSSGRKIDIHAAEREAAERAQEQLRKDAERKTWTQGLVQQQAAKQAATQLSAVREQGVARRATDADYNRHFRDQVHADDPALAFLTKRRTQGPAKPTYKGPWPANRYNIPPGYRWDGVDRSNGYEKLLVERKHALATQEQHARAWGQSDM